MALEAMISHYLPTCNTNYLFSSSSLSLGIENHQTPDGSFIIENDPRLPPLPKVSPIDLVPYSSSSYSSFVCQPSFAFGSSSVQRESKEQILSSTGENQKKRRRSRSTKDIQDLKNQRMTHIVVERNRRKQMNEHLAMLRSLMPASYIQRGDQASIVGGAIDLVKELEQLVQSLEVKKRTKDKGKAQESLPFASFFTCPQYSFNSISRNDILPENPPAMADIEVNMTETHANLKVLSLRRPKQLFKMVSGLQTLHLTVLHLNVNTMDPFVFYSFSTKVEEECELTTVEEIAAAAYKMLSMVHEEAVIAGSDPKVQNYS